jgi:CubicO group peptidase (beta-lactamase class C family)
MKTLGSLAFLISLWTLQAGDRDPGKVVEGPAGALIDSYFGALETGGFSGTVLVARKGEILLHKGYGLADRGRKISCTTGTVFDLGSITKQFTAAAILKLEAEGKLKVEDRLSVHLEGVPEDKKDVTLHHLLTHTAGLDHVYGEDDDYAPRDLAVKLFLRMPLLSKPGERYHYSNPGFSLLAAVVEKLSGMSYEAYLHDRFFQPLGMEHTGYFIPRWNILEVSRNYSGEEDNGWTFNRNWGPEGPYWHLYGNGGILSTTGDLYKWEQALMSDRVLPAEARKKLFGRHAPEGSDASSFYGYGWRVGTSDQDMAFSGHGGGSSWGVAAAYFRFPEQGILVLVLSNQASFPGGEGAATLTGRIAAMASSSP